MIGALPKEKSETSFLRQLKKTFDVKNGQTHSVTR